MESSLVPHLARVFAAPESSHRWHSLHQALSENGDNPGYAELMAKLETYCAPNLESRFLHATCLHTITSRPEYLRAAADAAKQIVPMRIERIHALLLHAWSHALTFCPTRDNFSAVFAAIDAPELLALVSRELETYADNQLRRRPIEKLRRVAVLAPDVRSGDHAPTAMAVKQVSLLQGAGIEAELFAMQEQEFAAMPLFLGADKGLKTGSLNTDSWLPLIRGSLKWHLANPQSSLFQRWRWTLAELDAFDPDVVLFVGFHSPLPYLISRRRPQAAISIHTVPPIIPTDVWLAPDPKMTGAWRSPWSEAFPPAFAQSHPFRVIVKPAGRSLSRSELKLPANAILLLSIGDRLTAEISQPWSALMSDFLVRHPTVHWLMVGGVGTLPPALLGGSTERIWLLPHQSDVRSVCRCCDIFVNPRRMGGGFSVAAAMAEGLAIVAYGDSDGGDKLGELASTNDAAYFATLEALVREPQLRQARGAALKRRFFEELDIEHGTSTLVAGCEKAIAGFNQRIA